MNTFARIGVIALLVAVIAACHTAPGRTLQTELTLYRVKSGDSLKSIAWRYALNEDDIAQWNKLKKPGHVFPGQLIRLSPPPGYQHKYSEESRKLASSEFPQGKKPPKGKAGQPPPPPAAPIRIPPPPPPAPPVARKNSGGAVGQTESPASTSGSMAWIWPTDGRVVSGFQATSIGRSGIHIAGVAGQPIQAAEAGTVVYSGSGLKGYKEMIIIQHPGNYLTAYAYNRKRFVIEHDRVQKGQKIAEMGSNDDGRSMLHFEIRHNGKPVNPMSYLPSS